MARSSNTGQGLTTTITPNTLLNGISTAKSRESSNASCVKINTRLKLLWRNILKADVRSDNQLKELDLINRLKSKKSSDPLMLTLLDCEVEMSRRKMLTITKVGISLHQNPKLQRSRLHLEARIAKVLVQCCNLRKNQTILMKVWSSTPKSTKLKLLLQEKVECIRLHKESPSDFRRVRLPTRTLTTTKFQRKSILKCLDSRKNLRARYLYSKQPQRRNQPKSLARAIAKFSLNVHKTRMMRRWKMRRWRVLWTSMDKMILIWKWMEIIFQGRWVKVFRSNSRRELMTWTKL